MADIKTLEEWRLNWRPDELEWRTGPDSWRNTREDEMAQRKRERALRDRTYFGPGNWGASDNHRKAETDPNRLKARDLPILADEKALADWLVISLAGLRWFSHGRLASQVWHYVRYTIRKRSGGERVILAPKTDLKALQRKILREILERILLAPSAHGFARGRSIVSNACPHVAKQVVLNLDLKDFFPTITFPRVRGLFIALGYSFSVASALAMLCTEHDRETLKRADRTYYVAIGPRHLVQGAPTSPILANLLARRLDARLRGLAKSRGFDYTRYADDLTFSGDSYEDAMLILDSAENIIEAEGFAINKAKTRLYRRSARQMVTGLVVNDRTSTPRELRRMIRAILHNAARTGLQAQNRDSRQDFRAYLLGMIGHIQQTEPEQARKLRARLRSLPD